MTLSRGPRVQDKIGSFNQFFNGAKLADEFVVDVEPVNGLNSEENLQSVLGDPDRLDAQGIKAHPSLVEYLAGNYYDRCMKIVITQGYFCLAYCLKPEETWEDDWDDMVLGVIDDDEPCYILFRTDEPRGRHFEHILVTWQPDEAPLKERAAYTSSKNALIELFEEDTFTHQMVGQQECDIDFNALKYILMGEGEIQPLSKYEILKQQANEEEELMRQRPMKKIPDIDMDIENDAIREIQKFVKGFVNFVQFGIDTKKEIIRVTNCTNINILELPDMMCEDQPRFNLYRYSHLKDGNHKEYVPVFIYHIPEAGTAKSRQFYPCAIDHFVKNLQAFGCKIELRLEFSDMADMTEGVLFDAIYPESRESREAAFKNIKVQEKKGHRGGWVKVLPV